MFLLLLSIAFATPVQIQVVDANDGQVLSEANVRCFKDLKTKELVEQQTDNKGYARLECGNGKQDFVIFHPNYGRKHIPYEIIGRDVSMRVRLEASQMIIVEDEKQTSAITRHVITAEELKMVPGTFGDPVRALQSLPGVARPNVAEGTIVVRGAEGINTGFYVDGMPVPYMFHSLVGRSIIIPNFIDDIEFFPGGMPSNYGEVTQAVVNVRTDTEPVEGTKITLRVDFLDGGISLEQRLTDKMVLRMAGRYSWVGGLISGASKIISIRNGGNAEEAAYIAPQYWDSFADLRYQMTPVDEISLLFLQSRDILNFHEGRTDDDGDGEPDPLVWEDQDLSYDPTHWIDNRFIRARLQWTHDAPLHKSTTWIASGTEEQQNLLGAWWLSRQGPYRGRVGGPSIIARRTDRWVMNSWGEGSGIESGAQFTSRWFEAEDFQDIFSDNQDERYQEISTTDQQKIFSTWVEPQWQTDTFYIGSGIRGAFYSWDDNTRFEPEPRLSLRYNLPEEWIIKGAVGRYTQLPPLERYAQGIGNTDLDIMKAWQASIGTEGEIGNGIKVDSSFFGGWMTDLVVRDLEVDSYNNDDVVIAELQPYYLGVQGLAYGWEGFFRLRPNQRNWWGWVSLTLAKSMRLDEAGRLFPSDYDQPIGVTVVGAYDLGFGWEASARVQYTSGQPFTPLYGVYVPNDEYFTSTRGDLNSDRYPYFFRIDTRVQKELVRKWVDWTFYLDVFNLTSRQNPFIATYTYDYSELVDIASLPIIPTIGFEATY